MVLIGEQKTTTVPSAKDEPRESLLESIASISVVFVLALFVMTFIVQNFEIPTGSMEKTLLIGDHILVDHITLAPQAKWMPFVHSRSAKRGDIIVFLKPHPEKPDFILVKRLVGIAGDRIHLRKGILYLNGVAQNEPYAAKPVDDGDPNHAYVPYRDDFPMDLEGISAAASANKAAAWAVDLPNHIQGDDLVVPDGMVFAMGDNRLGSLDSRFWGFVPTENILGRPLLVYWSFDTPADQEDKQSIGERLRFYGHVALHIVDGTRWRRTLHLVR